jgi:hypothetical protein
MDGSGLAARNFFEKAIARQLLAVIFPAPFDPVRADSLTCGADN